MVVDSHKCRHSKAVKIQFLLIEALESGMCDVIKIRFKGGMQREVGKETSR